MCKDLNCKLHVKYFTKRKFSLVVAFIFCYGGIPHAVSAWTLHDTMNSDWLD